MEIEAMSKTLKRRCALAGIVATLILSAGACFEMGYTAFAISEIVVAGLLFIVAPMITEDD